MQHEHYTHTAPDIPSSTALSIFFFLPHFLLMQLLFFLLVPFQDFLHSLLCSRPILHTGQFDQQITHDHSIMGTANDKSYDATHDATHDKILAFCIEPHSKLEIAEHCGYKNTKNFSLYL